MREQEIYIEAMNRQDPADRRRVLDEACGDDSALRERVEKLIRHSDQVGKFLENPPQPLALTPDMQFVTEKPGTRIGPYKLLQQIGEGGFGVVYMASQNQNPENSLNETVLGPAN